VHLLARLGFQDDHHIPDLLRESHGLCEELQFDTDTVSYFLSHITIERGPQPGMSSWRKRLFIALAHNAATPATHFKLPLDRTVVMGSRIEL
jgi:KUP system potassium uptake protein